MEKYGIIYCATNIKNGKKYIGQTTRTLEQRKNRHLNDAKNNNGSVFQRAIRKYGEKNFKWEILIYNIELKYLDFFEVNLIRHHNSLCPKGYNLDSGGSKNKIVSEETKKKISDSVSGEKNGFFGKKHTEKTKEKIRKSKKGKKLSEEIKEKMNKNRRRGEDHYLYGKKPTEDCILLNKISNINKPISKRNKSGYKGVHFHKSSKKWRAKNGQNIIGYFDCAKKAAEAYDEYIVELFGNKVLTNKKMGLI